MDLPPPLIDIDSDVPSPSLVNGHKQIETTSRRGDGDTNLETSKNCQENGVENVGNLLAKSKLEEEESEDDEDSEIECAFDEENDFGNVVYECLICDKRDRDDKGLVQHMADSHGLDLFRVRDKYSMDQLSFIKMVNWLRHLKFLSKQDEETYGVLRAIGLRDLLSTFPPTLSVPWSSDRWLKTSIENDGLLQYCIEPLSESPEPEHFKAAGNVAENLIEKKTDTVKHLADDSSSKVIEDLRNALSKAYQEQHLMKEAMSRILGQNPDLSVSKLSKRDDGNETKTDVVEVEDSWYFESYDDLGIHAEMLKDHPRTLAYKRAIQDNAVDFRGKTVLDLGCGTGILSLFCADTGAELVHAVDSSKIIYDAMDICFENNLESKIKFQKGKIETLDTIEKVDIIVSEWMGYFLIFEGMLNSFLYARDTFLKPDGKLFPSTSEMFIVAVSDEEKYASDVDMWDLQHGYKMGAMKKRVLLETAVQFVDKSTIVSQEISVKKLDLHTCQPRDTLISGQYEFNIQKDCLLTAVGGYFSVGFDDCSINKEQLSTSPFAPPTHWKQVVFYLPEKLKVTKDEKVPIQFKCKPHPHNCRWLQIDIKIGSISTSYEMC